MLDMNQAETLVGQLREADRTDKVVDPALPLALARARRETDEAFAGLPQDGMWLDAGSSFGLVAAGLAGLARWLKEKG